MFAYPKVTNDARKELFTLKGRDMDDIPPTGEALCQHAKRTAFPTDIAGTSAWKNHHNFLLQANEVG